MTKRRSDRNRETPPLVMGGFRLPAAHNIDDLQKRQAQMMQDDIEPTDVAVVERPTVEVESSVPVQAPAGRVYKEIPVALIDQNRFHPRSLYQDDVVAERAEALRVQGQHDPIHVIPHPDAPGRYIICDGWTRVLACVRHKIKESLLAEVHFDLTEKQGAFLGYQQNEERSAHFHYDRAMFFKSLLDDGMRAVDIAESTGTDTTVLSHYSAFWKLPQEIMDVVLANPQKFTVNAVYPIYLTFDATDAHQALKLANRYQKEDRSIAWLKEQKQLIVEHQRATRKPRKAPGTKVNYANGSFKQNGQDFKLSLTVEESKVEDFRKRLEELLEEFAVTSTAPAVQQASD